MNCPNCTTPLPVDSDTRLVSCPVCHTEYDLIKTGHRAFLNPIGDVVNFPAIKLDEGEREPELYDYQNGD